MAPNQTMATVVRFITSIKKGIREAIIRFTRIAVAAKSLLALPKRRCSWPLRLKARITRMPLSVSRIKRLIRSSLTCMALNNGSPFLATRRMAPPNTGMDSSSSESAGSLETAMITPPMHISGAMAIMRMSIINTIWIWVISLVVLVIKEAVLNWSNSGSEKLCTFAKTRLRRSRPNPAAVAAER